ncbi:Sm-like ribonucleoprotein [Atractiella rhizophila]|nr:Sm-like ribonucleoprotein [Atractiella rhizophila]
MLPLALLKSASNKPMLVELKNGETFNGHLQSCDNFMNLLLREVFQTSARGDKFWKMDEVYIRGNTIKYVRVADSVIDALRAQMEAEHQAQRQRTEKKGDGGRGRGRGGDRGRGRGRGRGKN